MILGNILNNLRYGKNKPFAPPPPLISKLKEGEVMVFFLAILIICSNITETGT